VTERKIDWRAFLNKLVYCYGCGQFRMPRKGERKVEPPPGWTVLYQPHSDAPAGLLVCSAACREKVQKAMAEGPVYEPLKAATNVPMMTDMREQMMEDAMLHAVEEGRLDDLFSEAVEERDERKGRGPREAG
jgi:hypothetical protein